MIKPIRDNLLIKPFKSESISDGGIFVPDSFAIRNNKALVVAVGNGIKDKPMRFKKGDVIYNIKDAGDELIIDGEKYYMIKDNYILAQSDN